MTRETRAQSARYSRSAYRRGHLDFAYICAHCGTIRLGAPCVDPRDPPDPPTSRCKACHRVEWIESVVPAFDPSLLDIDAGHNLINRMRAQRFASTPSPLPDYYSSDSEVPRPQHSTTYRSAAPRRKGFAPAPSNLHRGESANG